jgi:PilZ domain
MLNPSREQPKTERRKSEKRMTLRRPARRAATVTFGAEKPPVTCVIWDISEGGARLAVAHPLATLPHHFTLILFKDGSVRRDCEVVWTDARFVGVKFTSLAP